MDVVVVFSVVVAVDELVVVGPLDVVVSVLYEEPISVLDVVLDVSVDTIQ